MSPIAFDETEYEAQRDQLAKGILKIGGLNVMWDFTELIQEQRAREMHEKTMQHFITKSGRILMPRYHIL